MRDVGDSVKAGMARRAVRFNASSPLTLTSEAITLSATWRNHVKRIRHKPLLEVVALL